MTMHLVGPYLSTTGKRKGKQKFKSAADAKRARELAQDWDSLKTKWGVDSSKKKKPVSLDLPTKSQPYIRDTGPRPQSLNSWNVGAVSTKPSQQYTGESIVGISQMAKSNAIPVFNQEHVIDIARMRR